MHLLRKAFDSFYLNYKEKVFSETEKDPELAHEKFVDFLTFLNNTGMDKILFEDSSLKTPSKISLSNAAGFNKNGEIPLSTLEYLGFERAVVGTVTFEPWKGNDRPRVKRYPRTESLVNWMGLPGDGAEEVAERIYHQKSSLPLTINLMSTPKKEGDELLKDLENTILTTNSLNNLDRYELNISCPNTHSNEGKLDSRNNYQKQLDSMLSTVEKSINSDQELYLKVSPDLDEKGIDQIFSVCLDHNVKGFTLTNTTTFHDPNYIFISPNKGGASGEAVHYKSLATQKTFDEKISNSNSSYKIIACGGINSIDRVIERRLNGSSEIQLYTPLIFSGTKLLTELRLFYSK